MFADVVDLRDFYATRTGRVARRIVRDGLRAVWPDVRGQRVLGLGYATPFLTPFEGEAERVLSFMPAQQGVMRWPASGRNRATLVDEGALPLSDFSVDRVVLVHALETTENLREMLREVWRVLMGDGRVVVIVPNRRGLWSRFDSTPFGQGKPFSSSQLAALLREMSFMPMQTRRALFVPPTRSRTLLGAAPALERVGQRWMPHFGGVLMLEAGKQLYAVNQPKRAAEPVRQRVTVPVPGVAPPAAARRHSHANDA